MLSGHQLSEFITIQNGGPLHILDITVLAMGMCLWGWLPLPSGDAVSPSVSTHALTDLRIALWVVWTQREGVGAFTGGKAETDEGQEKAG